VFRAAARAVEIGRRTAISGHRKIKKMKGDSQEGQEDQKPNAQRDIREVREGSPPRPQAAANGAVPPADESQFLTLGLSSVR
jgi:hypothetical protein